MEKFIEVYPALVDDAREHLRGLFNDADYPAAAELAGLFGFRGTVSPLAAAGDFRANISTEAATAIRTDIENRINAAQTKAMSDLWQRLYDGVRHMVEKLEDPEAIFRDSLVENLTELAAVLPALNFANDAGLESLAAEVKAKLTEIEPETLRTAPLVRREVATDAAKLLKAITGAGARFIDLS